MLAKMFEFEGVRVRVIMIEGKPWFVASDVAKVLGYRDAANGVRAARLRKHQHRYSDVSTPSGTQRMHVISEAGLYRMVMRSERPEAEAFQDWIEGEVIPSLLAKGTYTVPGAESALPDFGSLDPKSLRLIHNLTSKAIEEGARAEAAEAEVVECKAVIAELAPAAAFAAATLDHGDDMLVADAAAKLSNEKGIGHVSERDLRDHLLATKRLCRRGKAHRLHATAKARKQGLVTVRYSEPFIDKVTGKERRSTTPLVTPKLLAKLLEEFREARRPKPALEVALAKAQQLTLEQPLTPDEMEAIAREKLAGWKSHQRH